ncbi:uncharacterized protein [Palaemon carinicauda]|uniref:uncharacterized protein n=1 Tax=Palaemon carinicauda TaxID=392227 RepID=UPI0035B62407
MSKNFDKDEPAILTSSLKVAVLLCVVAAAAGDKLFAPPPPPYLGHHGHGPPPPHFFGHPPPAFHHEPIHHHVPPPPPHHHHEEINTHPAYSYNYVVVDNDAGVNFAADETRDGHHTHGSYEVLLPDGRKQIVTYTDDGNGLVAEVSYKS